MSKDLERELSELLMESENTSSEEDRNEEGRKRLSPRYEIRIQTSLDPIVEETKIYRSMAGEIDDRYDEYLKRSSYTDENSE